MSDTAIEAIRARMVEHFGDKGWKGKKNAYVCEDARSNFGLPDRKGCRSYIVTIDLELGVTPFMVSCGKCGNPATSKMYRVSERLQPTHEWYRPETMDEVEPIAREHVENGGLLLRPVAGYSGRWLPQG